MVARKKPKKKSAPKVAPLGALRDPRTGKFVKRTLAVARRIESALRSQAKRERSERRKLYKKVARGAKLKQTRERDQKRYAKVSKKADSTLKKLDAAARQLEQLKKERARPSRLPREVEFGVAYVAGRRDRGSDVNFNIRIARVDGKGISREQALRAIERLAENGVEHIEDEYEVTSVEWSRSRSRMERGTGRWSSSVRSGGSSDADAFRPMLMEVIFNRNGEGLRMGAVREDDAWLLD